MEITYGYTKKRSCFGRQPLFCEQGPEMCDNISIDVAQFKNFGLRNPVHQHTQHTPCFSRNELNTIRADYTNTGTNHMEGGWPKDVNVADPEATQRYRRKIEKDDGYIHCVMAQASGMEHYVLQNNAIDMYNTYYKQMRSQPALERSSCRTINIYRDPIGNPGRPVTSICWQPDFGHQFAVTHCDVDFYHQPRSGIESFIWDLENANDPIAVFKPESALLDLQYSPRDPNTLAGGMMNGQVGIWDRRISGAAVTTCPPHVAHRDLVRNVRFINSKSGQEFFSGGTDGACKWWDARKLDEPLDEMIIDVVKFSFETQSMSNANGICCLEYEPTLPTRFMVGTENGLIIGANRKGKNPLEKLPLKVAAHLGPIWSVERNPGFLKNFLTVGDWTLRLWSEECRDSSIIWSPPQRHKITAATWSPTRISLIAVAQANGVLSWWDLLRRQHEPIVSMQVCSEPLLRVQMHQAGALAACGSQAGTIFMVEVSANMATTDPVDKVLLTAVLEREAKRERILEARMREVRLKQRQAEEGSPIVAVSEVELPTGDRDLIEATADYMQQVKKELATF